MAGQHPRRRLVEAVVCRRRRGCTQCPPPHRQLKDVATSKEQGRDLVCREPVDTRRWSLHSAPITKVQLSGASAVFSCCILVLSAGTPSYARAPVHCPAPAPRDGVPFCAGVRRSRFVHLAAYPPNCDMSRTRPIGAEHCRPPVTLRSVLNTSRRRRRETVVAGCSLAMPDQVAREHHHHGRLQGSSSSAVKACLMCGTHGTSHGTRVTYAYVGVVWRTRAAGRGESASPDRLVRLLPSLQW